MIRKVAQIVLLLGFSIGCYAQYPQYPPYILYTLVNGIPTAVTGSGTTLQGGMPPGFLCYGLNVQNQPAPCTFGSGTGTVTSFSAGDLSPLFTTSVANPTSTPALTFTLSSAAQNSVFGGPAVGGAGAPSFQTAPTISAANMTNFPTFNQNTTGTAASIAGGVLGSIPYQSAAGTTAFLAPNTSTTQEVVTETGTGSVGAAPTYLAIGTSGATIPLLSTANTWTSAQTGTSFVTTAAAIGASGFSAGSGVGVEYSSTSSYTGTKDVGSDRASAGVWEFNNGTVGNSLGQAKAAGFVTGGVKFTTSGCSVSSTTGGATAGVMTIGANTCTVTITMNGATGLTAPNGWSCSANDQTTAAAMATLHFTAPSTTQAFLVVPSTAGTTDVIDFKCGAY